MISLYTYITEGAYNLAWSEKSFKDDESYNTPKDAEEYINHINGQFHNLKDLKNFQEFLSLVAGVWQDSFGMTKELIPLRFTSDAYKKDNKLPSFKLARAYWEVEEVTKPLDIKPKGSSDRKINIDGVSIEEGNGMGGGLKGYKFEDEMVEALIQYFVAGLSIEEPNDWKISPDAKKALMKINNNADLRDILVKAQDYYAGLPGKNEDYVKLLKDQIYKTGESKNKRGIRNIIPSRNEEDVQRDPNKDINKEIRDQSGEIISDININISGNQSIHLSIKRSKAQLSGIAVQDKETGKYMENILKIAEQRNSPDYDYLSHQGGIAKDLEEFNGFRMSLGIDPKSVYDGWKNRKPKDQLDLSFLEDKVEGMEEKIGEMVQNILGGNYWYVSPDTCVWVPPHSLHIKYIPDRSYITAGANGKKGTGVVIKGKIEGDISADLTIRSTGSGYPYRMFTIVDVQDLLSKVGEEKK